MLTYTAGTSLGFTQDGCKVRVTDTPYIITSILKVLLFIAILRAWQFLALKAVLDTSPLSSGRVRRTRCQISAGADAPVAPVLTRSVIYVLN